MAPINTSPVPWLTSLYHKKNRGAYGDPGYPGNCSGEFIKDLLLYFRPKRVLDPMTGSGTCADVCRELGIACVSGDVRTGFDACDPATYAGLGQFDFVWVHPPYWRQKLYADDPRCLSRCPNLPNFLQRYALLIDNCRNALTLGGKLAILMGDYSDRDEGFVPRVPHQAASLPRRAEALLHRHHPLLAQREQCEEDIQIQLHPRPARRLFDLREREIIPLLLSIHQTSS